VRKTARRRTVLDEPFLFFSSFHELSSFSAIVSNAILLANIKSHIRLIYPAAPSL
jgi:hypothetical protein